MLENVHGPINPFGKRGNLHHASGCSVRVRSLTLHSLDAAARMVIVCVQTIVSGNIPFLMSSTFCIG